MVDLVNELAGKVAIVTGSARNIGRATVKELARAGASVVVHARESKDLCDEVVDEITADGGKAIACTADIRDADAVAGLMAAALEAFGGIDILVNNAAMRSHAAFTELDDENWNRIIDTTIQGAFNTCRAAVPHIIKRGGGSIVSVGGMTAHRGAARRVHVMTAKAALGGLTRGLALDLGQYGIRANTLVVGAFDTVRSANAPESSNPADLKIPMGRLGAPQDMADLIRFMVGPGATYISGQTIHCNGAAYVPH